MSTTHDKALSRALSTGYLRYCSCVKPGFHPIATIHVDCEQFLFFFKYWGVRARGSFACLARFARRTKKAERLLVVYDRREKNVQRRGGHTETTLQRSQ